MLHHFIGIDGAYPPRPLLEVSDGVFFGVANDVGVQHWGSAFRLSAR